MRHDPFIQEKSSELNPLDRAEEVLLQRDLAYDRPADDEIVGEISSLWGTLRLWYRWEEVLGMLVFTCTFENKTPKIQRQRVYPLLVAINEKLWLGHFDFSADEGVIFFRYSLLTRMMSDVSVEQLEQMLDIAVTECDRFYPALQAVIWGNQSVEDALNLALFETCGEA